MPVQRMIRVNELLKREVAGALYRVMSESGFDLAAVTVTDVITGTDLRTARVRVSIRDHKDDRTRLLGLLAHHRKDIQRVISKNVILKYTPVLSFELDGSIERGDHVLQIIHEIEKKEPETSEDGGGDA